MTFQASPLDYFLLLTGAVAFIVWNRQLQYRKRSAGRPTPPQRPGLPILGNYGQMPKKGFPWTTYIEWGKELDSDIVFTDIAGTKYLIVNNYEKAVELLDKRSGIFSDRPPHVLFDDLMGWGYILSRLPYGDAWRERRRLFQRHLRPAKADIYQPRIIEHIRRSMVLFSKRPDDSLNVLKHTIGGIAISLAYGLKTHPYDDPHVVFAEKVLTPLRIAASPGIHPINVFPILRHVPSWMPGAGFKRKAVKHRVNAAAFRERPFAESELQIASSQAHPSFTSFAIDEWSQSETRSQGTMEAIKDTAAIVYAAGSETTSATIIFWMRDMITYPVVQRRVQQELDSVLQGRIPDFPDKGSLPWVQASLMESMRMNPTTPQAVPHSSSEDDIFEGYFIPKGTTVIPNTWAMLHDENVYSSPMSYNPGRFITDGKLNDLMHPHKMAFGFGRRECAGTHIAEDMMFIAASTLLSIFDICKPLNKLGEPIEPGTGVQPGAVSHAMPFDCVLKVRSGTRHQATLQDLEAAYGT